MYANKAVAAIVAALASVLVTFNVDISEELQGAIIVIVSAITVYFAPKNSQ